MKPHKGMACLALMIATTGPMVSGCTQFIDRAQVDVDRHPLTSEKTTEAHQIIVNGAHLKVRGTGKPNLRE
ncbi:copper amine oxidase family protein [Leptolyngbya sp. Heron Island J]|uniref:hypothetical protein n=1 Tax=Leptolyngbya sp. Heron Island J TaxID=1385935 RepID=UPI0003B9FAF7|nr:hypothetical protein [Leptolyngbya sp. Heron Island J]ESA37652.1 copper amine oxidase family protein [Leptolyngbya sp. Heron Island J]